MNIAHRTLSLVLAIAACCTALPGCASRDETSRNLEFGGDLSMPLEANINQSGMNTTRFAVLSRVENTQERSRSRW